MVGFQFARRRSTFIPSWRVRTWFTQRRSKNTPHPPSVLDQTIQRGSAPMPTIAYWRSSHHPRPSPRFFGQAASFGAAMEACEAAHGRVLEWQEVDRGHYTARATDFVYTVRFEA
ncbi:hypothetical protein DES52_108191 [Deinococcus yavapaiensis KR-236]|uniref:Uncharacterized protein n=1 Tax=Deinococcus yavapaiensis KR-236 TaxID=694435 RepID=A0A318SMG1_9DEIO|nr:hypothetical protein DES52_108191 [Deinococcus yavapaiensis KR-236]